MKDAILIVGHGSETLTSTSAPIRDCVRRLRAEGYNASCAFWKGTPNLKGAIERTSTETGTIVIVPFFLANGFYAKTRVPEVLELDKKRDTKIRYTDPIGVVPKLAEICLNRIESKRVVVIGHGTKRSKTSRDSTFSLCETLVSSGIDARAAFVDDEPSLEETIQPGDVLFPFFAARSGHVIDDIEAAFPDHVCLDPIGVWPEIDELVLSLVD